MLFNNSKNKFSKRGVLAFTLAEILIVIAVVGVLVMILLPAENNTAPDYNKIMFKKAFFSAQTAVKMMISDENNYPSSETANDVAGISVEKGFNYTNQTTNLTATNAVANKFCYFLVDKFNTIVGGDSACPLASGTKTSADFSNPIAQTNDGILWDIYVAASDGNPDAEFPRSPTGFSAVKLLVDVNGTSKGPNCSNDSNAGSYGISVCGAAKDKADPDRYIIGVRYDGKLQIGCTTPNVEYCSTDQTAIDILANPTSNKKN